MSKKLSDTQTRILQRLNKGQADYHELCQSCESTSGTSTHSLVKKGLAMQYTDKQGHKYWEITDLGRSAIGEFV